MPLPTMRLVPIENPFTAKVLPMSPEWTLEKFGSSGRTRTYNPPVNSRIQPVLLGVAGDCGKLLEGAYPSWRQELATCCRLP
jgi:hypothetical protein